MEALESLDTRRMPHNCFFEEGPQLKTKKRKCLEDKDSWHKKGAERSLGRLTEDEFRLREIDREKREGSQ